MQPGEGPRPRAVSRGPRRGRGVGGDADEQADGDGAGDHAGPTVGHEGQRDPGHGEELGHATDDDRRLGDDARRQARRQEGAEVVLRPPRRHEASDGEEGEEQDDRAGPDQPQLLADGREDEVGGHLGDARWHPLPQPRPEHIALGEGEEGLDHLVPARVSVGPGVAPGLDPRLHVGEHALGAGAH